MLLRTLRFKLCATQWWRYPVCILVMAAAVFRITENIASINLNGSSFLPSVYSFNAYFVEHFNGFSNYILLIPLFFLFADIYSGQAASREGQLFLRLPGKGAWVGYNAVYVALLALFTLVVSLASMLAAYLARYGVNPVMFSGSSEYLSGYSVDLTALGLTVNQALGLTVGLTFGYFLFSGAFLLLFNLLTRKRSMGFIVLVFLQFIHIVVYWVLRPPYPLGITPIEHQSLTMKMPYLPSYLDRFGTAFYWEALRRPPYWTSFLYFGLGALLLFALAYYWMLSADILSQEGPVK